VAYFLVNSEFGQAQARSRVAALFPNAGLAFDEVEVGAVPVDLHVHGLRLGPPDTEPLAALTHVAVGVDPRSLFGGPLRVQLVHVDGFELRLAFDEEGRPIVGDLFQGPLAPKPGEPKRPARALDLRDLVLSDGTLRLSGPDWDVRLVGTDCAGRVAAGGSSDLHLSCSCAGGEARVTPAGEQPVTFHIGPSRFETLHVTREGERVRRIVLDGLRLELDGVALQGSLTVAPGAADTLPVFTAALNGGLPESVVRILSRRRVEGGLALNVMAEADAEHVQLTVQRLALDGRVRLPERSITSPTLSEVRLEARGRDLTLMGKGSAAAVSGGDVRASDVALQTAIQIRLPEGGLPKLLAEPPAAPTTLAESLQARVDRLSVGSLETDRVQVSGLSVADVDLDWKGFGGTLRVRRAAAKTVVVDGRQLADVSLDGSATLDWPNVSATLRVAPGAGAGKGALHTTGRLSVEWDGLTPKLPFSLDVRVSEVPGAWLVSLLPADLAQRADVAALLPGPVNGTLRIEGDARQSKSLKLSAADLRVPREKDIVTFGPAADPLAAEGGAVVVELASRRLRVGPATLAWQTQKVATPKTKGPR
jgi:hypothetical protein